MSDWSDPNDPTPRPKQGYNPNDLGPPPKQGYNPNDLGAPPGWTPPPSMRAQAPLSMYDKMRLFSNAATGGVAPYVSAGLGAMLGQGSYADQLALEKGETANAKEKPGAMPYRVAGTAASLAFPWPKTVGGAAAVGGVLGLLNSGFDDPGLAAGQRAERGLMGGGLGAVTGGAAQRYIPPAIQAINETAPVADALKVPLSAAQALKSRGMQMAQDITGLFPFGKHVLAGLSQRQQEALGGQLDQAIAYELGGPASRSQANQAARHAQQSVTSSTLKGFKDAKDAMLPKLAEGNPDGVFLPAVQDWLDQTAADASKESAPKALLAVREYAQQLVNDANNGHMDPATLFDRRSIVGDRASVSKFDDASVREAARYWHDLHGAMQGDLQEAADNAGLTDAMNAYNRSVREWHDPNNPAGAAFWKTVERSKQPAKTLTSGLLADPATAQAVTGQLPDDARRTLASHWLDNMRMPNAGQADAMGEGFTGSTFLKRLNQASTPEARNALLGSAAPKVQQVADVADLARVNALPNPSGTASSLQGAHLASALGRAARDAVVTAGGTRLLGGTSPMAEGGAALLSAFGPYVAAKAQVSPLVVNKLLPYGLPLARRGLLSQGTGMAGGMAPAFDEILRAVSGQ